MILQLLRLVQLFWIIWYYVKEHFIEYIQSTMLIYCFCVGPVARRVKSVSHWCNKFCEVDVRGSRENQKSVAGSRSVFWTFAALRQCSNVAIKTDGFEAIAVSVLGFAIYDELDEISKRHTVWDRCEQVLCRCASWFWSFCKCGG